MAQLMPLPLTVSCFSEIQIGFTFLVPAHPVVPEKGLLNGSVCVVVLIQFDFSISSVTSSYTEACKVVMAILQICQLASYCRFCRVCD